MKIKKKQIFDDSENTLIGILVIFYIENIKKKKKNNDFVRRIFIFY